MLIVGNMENQEIYYKLEIIYNFTVLKYILIFLFLFIYFFICLFLLRHN